jgi:ClpP class serine protease
MKSQTLVILFIASCAMLCVQTVEGHPKKLDRLDRLETTYDDALVEENPDYTYAESDTFEETDGHVDDSDDDDDDEMEIFEDSVKGKIEEALAKTKKQSRKTMKLAKKHRTRITLALAVFAFRREIRKTIIHVVTKEIIDPKTGKLRVSTTSILKVLLFVDFMRRLQGGGLGNTTSSFHTLVAIGETNPIMGVFFSKFLRVPTFNPAYIPPVTQHYTFERINERYIKDGMALHKAIHSRHEGFKWPAADPAITRAVSQKGISSAPTESNETVIIMDLTKLGTTISNMEQVRDEVSFLLSQYRSAAMMDDGSTNEASSTAEYNTIPELEIVVLLESPGGSAADYGLAAQQLMRLRNEPGIKLTICVDKVAASGGYMLACTASPGQLLAAPFAVVGSIGVVGQLVNVQSLLEGWGISPLVFRGGKDKAPLGLIGEVTQGGKDKVQSMIDDVHRAFKKHVVTARPVLEKTIAKIGSGDIWIGSDALDLDLVDRITTSDEYISEKMTEGAQILRLVKHQRARGFLFGRRGDEPRFETHQGLSIRDVATNALTKAAHFMGVSNAVSVMPQATDSSSALRFVASRVESPKAHI